MGALVGLSQSPHSGNAQLQFPTSQMLPLDIVGSNTYGRFAQISPARTINMFISDNSLVNLPGYKVVQQIGGGGEARQLYPSTSYNHQIVVVGSTVYTISPSYAVAEVGTLETDTGDVYIAENLAGQIAIADGKDIYIFNWKLETFTKATIDFLPGTIAYQDTYFIAPDTSTNKWRLSGNNDGLDWPASASNVGELQTKPGFSVAVVPVDRQLFVMGTNVTEPWQDVGAQLFPYQRSNYYSIDYGCLSPATIAFGYGFLAWLASNEKSGISIMVSSGAQPKRLSTDGIDEELSNIQFPKSSFGFMYRLNGHVLYQLTFTQDNKTYIYDFETQKFFTATDENQNHHIAKRVSYFNGKYYFISFNDNFLYEMDTNYTTYDGKQIPRARVCSPLRTPLSDNFIVNNITVTQSAGQSIGIQRIDLTKSIDGGVSYGNTVSQKMNAYGKRPNLFQFYNCGMSNNAVYQFRFLGDSQFCVNGAVAEISV